MAALGYMRGRTLNRSRLILDESQNSKLEMLKMCLTRLGEGSKMALVGDVKMCIRDSRRSTCAGRGL